MNLSIEEQRLKYDFNHYLANRLFIPDTEERYIPTSSHFHTIKTVMDNEFTIIEAYRGWGKSDLISYAWNLWRAEMWNESSIIFSANETLAFQKLDMIRTALESSNPDLSYMCSKGIEGYVWNRGEIWLIDRNKPKSIPYRDDKTGTMKEKVVYPIKCKLYARSIKSTSRGLHVENIIGDDIVVEDNSSSYELRDQTSKQFTAATVPIRKKNSRMIVVGTPQNENDLLAELIKNDLWASVILPVYDENQDPTCPELHDKKWIEQQRALQGEKSFMQEYMLKTMSSENAIFDWNTLNEAKRPTMVMVHSYEPRGNEIIVIGPDYSIVRDKAKAEKNDNDYFALSAVLFDMDTKKRRILRLYRERGIGWRDQLFMTARWIKDFNASAIGMELFGFLDIYKQEIEDSFKGFPIVDTGGSSGKFDLYKGIPSMKYEWEAGLWEVPFGDEYSRSFSQIFLNELNELGQGRHDDVADAVFRAEKVIQEYSSGIGYDENFSLYKKEKQQEKFTETSVFGPPPRLLATPIQELPAFQGSYQSHHTAHPHESFFS